jgi:hypothetical protein
LKSTTNGIEVVDCGFGEEVGAKSALWKCCLGAPLLVRRGGMIVLRSNIDAIIWRCDDCVVVDEIRG